jgi:hypothetical protein
VFKLLARIVSAVQDPVPKAPTASSRRTAARRNRADLARQRPAYPLPAPEVEEICDDSAWDMWEQSQTELDSRMGPISAFDSVRTRDGSPSKMSGIDPFASVRKRD